MKILATADTHGDFDDPLRHPQGEKVLIIAGDFAPHDEGRGIEHQRNVIKWLKSDFVRFCCEHGRCEIPIVIVPGNHDRFIHEGYQLVDWPHNVHLLCDQQYDMPGLKIYGTPWCPWSNSKGHASSQIFEDGDGMLSLQFAKIPEGIDVLVTHAPPKTRRWNSDKCSSALTERLKSMANPPRFVICGHKHGYRDQDEVIKAYNGKIIRAICVAETHKLFDV